MWAMNVGERQTGEPITYARIQATLDSVNSRLPVEVRRRPVYPIEEIEQRLAGRWVGMLQRTIAPGRSIDSARVLADAATLPVLERKVRDLRQQQGISGVILEFMGEPERVESDLEVIILSSTVSRVA